MTNIPAAVLDRTTDAKEPLQRVFERGDHRAVVNAALAYLEKDFGDPTVAFFAFRSYVALGLIGPALELVENGSELLAAMPELEQVRERLAKMPSGQVPWAGLAAQFERNVARVLESQPALRRHGQAFRAVPDTTSLYRSLDGSPHLSIRPPGRVRRWLPDLRDFKRLAAGLRPAHDPKQLFCAPYAILGDQFGAAFSRIYDATRKMFLTFTPRIYVLEPDERVFGAAIYAGESVDEWCDDRVTVLLGPDCIEGLLELLDREPGRAIPEYVMAMPSADRKIHDRLVTALRELTGRRVQQATAAIVSMRQHYDLLPQDHWAKRWSDGPSGKLRVLGMVSRFTTVLQYSMRDLKAAFEGHGHEFRLLIEENHHDVLPPQRIAEVIEQFRPDLIFLIDHQRREYRQVMPSNVPFVCWMQDYLPHLLSIEAGQSLGPLDFFVAPEIDSLARKFKYPGSQGMLWTMATNDRLYSSEPLPAEELARYRCDVSYVSNQSQMPRAFHEECLQRYAGGSREMVALMEHLFEAKSRQIAETPEAVCGTLMPLLEEAQRTAGISLTEPAVDRLGRSYLQPLAELMFRQSTLEWVANYCDRTGRVLHLYGNGWETHPRFAKYARGVARNGQELRGIYQASRINLQITSYGAIHQRLLDGLAAGGFFLIRYCPTDVFREPVERLLEVVKRHGYQAETTYRCGEAPELAQAMTVLADLCQETRPAEEFRLPWWRLEKYREMEKGGWRWTARAVFEEYDRVAFAAAEEFEKKADAYVADDRARQDIAMSMRAAVLRRFTYDALVRDLITFVRGKIGHGG